MWNVTVRGNVMYRESALIEIFIELNKLGNLKVIVIQIIDTCSGFLNMFLWFV